MSLQTEITAWKGVYDQTEINNYKSAYIGSICDVNGNYHTGSGIYDPSVSPPTYSIYDFNYYAGQGVDHITPSNGGGKFLVESAGGFSWDTTYSGGSYTFVTSGNLNTLYLGYTPSGDNGAAPAYSTLTSFEDAEPLLVINGLNIVLDYAATLLGGSGANANTSLSMTASSGGVSLGSLMSNSGLYTAATVNSAVLYTLSFENTSSGVTVLEWAMDKYLESIGSDITDSCEDIAIALANASSGVSIYCYEEAEGHYPADCDSLQMSKEPLIN